MCCSIKATLLCSFTDVRRGQDLKQVIEKGGVNYKVSMKVPALVFL